MNGTYYLVKIQNQETMGVFKYNSYDDALAAYHTELAYRGANRTDTLCVILGENGGTLLKERWHKQETES